MNTVVSFIGNSGSGKLPTLQFITFLVAFQWNGKRYENHFIIFEFNFLVVLHNSRKKLVYALVGYTFFFKFIYELPMSIRAILFRAHLQPYFTSFSANKNEIKKFISKLLSGGGFLLGFKICGGLLELLLQLDTVGLHVNKSFPQRWLENK